MPLSAVDLHRRLSFIKYLYRQALAQSRKPSPLEAATSILTFHDAVEAFLHLAVEHSGAQVKQRGPDFLEYWSLLAQAGCHLSPIGPLKRFNDVRVGLKHRGIFPSPEEIESARVNVTTFFEDNTPRAFRPLAFAEVSLAELVTFDIAKAALIRADKLMTEHQIESALQQIALAGY